MLPIDLHSLTIRLPGISSRFQAASPFRYVIIDDFLRFEVAQRIHDEFPPIDKRTWVSANGLQTRNKWTNPTMAGSVADQFYRQVNSSEFVAWLSRMTGIRNLLADYTLEGAGYHQTIDGGFLNVHIDFNKLRETGLDRRLNLIVYLNHGLQEQLGGALELWDREANRKIEHIPPTFNRCVIFETNEISFHGHPAPWSTGGKTSRKSLSVYYYSEGRQDIGAADSHTTMYLNTEGAAGQWKLLINGIRDLVGLGWIKRRLRRRFPPPSA